MTMLLVASVLPLLVVSTLAGPARPKTNSLNVIIDLAEKYNESLNKEFFVEDVRPLVEAGCEDTFFCKVSEILHGRRENSSRLVRTLKIFTDLRNKNCTELLKDVPSTGVRIQMPELMTHLTTCAQQRNWNMGRKSNP